MVQATSVLLVASVLLAASPALGAAVPPKTKTPLAPSSTASASDLLGKPDFNLNRHKDTEREQLSEHYREHDHSGYKHEPLKNDRLNEHKNERLHGAGQLGHDREHELSGHRHELTSRPGEHRLGEHDRERLHEAHRGAYGSSRLAHDREHQHDRLHPSDKHVHTNGKPSQLSHKNELNREHEHAHDRLHPGSHQVDKHAHTNGKLGHKNELNREHAHDRLHPGSHQLSSDKHAHTNGKPQLGHKNELNRLHPQEHEHPHDRLHPNSHQLASNKPVHPNGKPVSHIHKQVNQPATGKLSKPTVPNHTPAKVVDKQHVVDHKLAAVQKPKATPTSSVAAHPTHKTKLQEEIDELYRLSGRDWDEEDLFGREFDDNVEMYSRDYEDELLDLFQRSYFDLYDELD